MQRSQAGVRTQVGHLVLQGVGGVRAAGRLRFEGLDLRPQRRDLPAVCLIGPVEVLDAPHQGLVAGDLVGRRQQLRLDREQAGLVDHSLDLVGDLASGRDGLRCRHRCGQARTAHG